MGTIRPTTFAEFLGNTRAVEHVRTAVMSAKRQQRVLPHMLLTGPAGVGKTTLGMSVIPTELQLRKTAFINCAGVEKPQEFTATVATMPEGSLLFLDEVHRLPIHCREHLLTILEDQRLTVKTEDTLINVDLPRFTVIAATTRFGVLDGPLRTRFVYTIELVEYENEELAQILVWHAGQRGWRLDQNAARELSECAQGCARVAVNLLEACIDSEVCDNADYQATRQISQIVSTRTLFRLGYIDGLTPQQRSYITQLRRLGRVASLKTMADALDVSVETVETVYEPWLVRSGWIRRSSKGRELLRD